LSLLIEKVVCLHCGCLCDDVRLSVEGDRIVRAENVCPAGEAWFLALPAPHPAAAKVAGRAADGKAAIAEAARILSSARAPLVFGLSHGVTETQQAAVRLADRIGGTIDLSAAPGHAAAMLALEQVGNSTSTLGEVRHRADLVIFWGADPARTHPRHLERHSVSLAGRWIPEGRADRTVIVVDSQPTATSALANLFFKIEPGRDFELLAVLRSAVAGRAAPAAGVAGLSGEALADLAARMKGCRTGAIFYGPGMLEGKLAHQTLEALFRLVQELHRHARFYAGSLAEGANLTGADNVLAWQTGYPLAVNFARGYPRYSPGEFSAQAMLERGEADACLVVCREDLEGLSSRARQHLAKIPTIMFEPGTEAEFSPGFSPAVEISTAVDGIHVAGTAYRADGVPLPVSAVLPSPLASKAEVLREIAEALPKPPG
jgi:formylmethanofuran dehydrogenase subunit B